MRTADWGGKLRVQTAVLLFAAAGLSGCGGGSAVVPPSPPTPPVTVTVVGPSDTLNTGAPFVFTATAHNAANNAVNWSVVEPGGGSISPDGVYTAPAVPGTYTVKAVSQFDSSASGTAQVVVVVIHEGHIPGYDVGVDYHAYGVNFDQTAFLTIYNQPQVRQTVQAQLQGMADRGATFLQTSIWLVTNPGDSNLGQTWRATFPMSSQEAANLHAYAQDVAAVQGSGGNRLRLSLSFGWLGAADYTIGTPTTTLGYSQLTASQFTSRVQATIDSVLAAVSGVSRPDGVPLVNWIIFDGSIAFGNSANNTPNAEWFIVTHYPYFVSHVSQQGFKPTIEFLADGAQADVLDSVWTDPDYPILNNHRSMFWTYRGIKFFVDNGLPLPSQIDFDCYLVSMGATYDQLLKRILDDADATLPSLGAVTSYGCVEAYYLRDPSQRLQYAQAYAKQAAQNPRLQRVSFWTTPDGGGPPGSNLNAEYPFTLEDFFPPAP